MTIAKHFSEGPNVLCPLLKAFYSISKAPTGGDVLFYARWTWASLGRVLPSTPSGHGWRYNFQGLLLAKPDLRAQMEADMNRIAQGQLTQQDFLTQCLQAMRHIFHDVPPRIASQPG